MNRRNDGVGINNIQQNRFTAYLVTSIHRRKAKYLMSVTKIKAHEESYGIGCYTDGLQYVGDPLDKLPILEQIESCILQRSLSRMNEKNLRILLSRAVDCKAFTEIADELGISYRSVVLSYYRVSKKLRDEVNKNEFL